MGSHRCGAAVRVRDGRRRVDVLLPGRAAARRQRKAFILRRKTNCLSFPTQCLNRCAAELVRRR